MRMEAFTKATGSMVNSAVMAFSQALKVLSTTETGATTNNMARVKSVGLMEQNMSVNLGAGKRLEKGFSAGQTGQLTKEPF